jgi:hypothetical protein
MNAINTNIAAATRVLFVEYATKMGTDPMTAREQFDNDADLRATWETHARSVVSVFAEELRSGRSTKPLSALARTLYKVYMRHNGDGEWAMAAYKADVEIRNTWKRHARNVAGAFVADLVLAGE